MGTVTFVLWLVGLAFVTSQEYVRTVPRIRETVTAFKAGSTYVYDYTIQWVSGFPEMGPVYSVVLAKSTVQLQFKTATKVVMKVVAIKLFKVNGRVEAVDPNNELIPEELLEPWEASGMNEIKRAVVLPVRFRYTNGLVSNIEVEADDPLWSVNFKKGFLTIMQVNLDKAKAVKMSEKVVSEVYAENIVNEAYTVMETSAVGECECTYSVQELNDAEERVSGSSFFKVTKVRNFKNCLHRSEFFYETFGATRCAECEPWRVEPVKSTSEARYILTGTKEQFMIHEAVMESRHIVTPNGADGTYAATIINQTITLVSSDVIQAPISGPRVPKECSEGVRNVIPEILLHEKRLIAATAISQAPRDIIEIEESVRSAADAKLIVEEAVSALCGVAIDMIEGITEEGPAISMMAVEALRRATREEILEIWQTYGIEKSTEEPLTKNMRVALWNLLPFVGTVPATAVLCEAIQAKQITPTYVANVILPYLAMAAHPIPENVERLMTLARNEYINEDRLMRRSAWFTIGAVVFRMEKLHREKEEELSIQLEKTQEILSAEGKGKARIQLQVLADRIRMLRDAIVTSREQVRGGIEEALTTLLRSPKEEDKILALKTIGNAGIPEMIPLVVQLIEDKKAWPVIVRQQAVYSLRRIAENRPTEIVTILLPVFMDKTEHEVVRIAAYTTIVKAKPPVAILEMIARTLNGETNPQVASYVYSHLIEISNSTYPCLMSLATNATYALKCTKETPSDVHASFVRHYSFASEAFNLARVLEIAVIGSRDSILPRGISANLLAHVLGHSVNLGEVGIETRGVQAILDKLIGPEGILTKGKSVFDILRPKRSESARQEVDKIIRDLKVVMREAEDTVIDVYVRYGGHDMIFYTIDATVIRDLLESGSIFTSISEESLRSGLNIDWKLPQPLGGVTYVIPTDSGVPVRAQLHVAMMVGASGRWTTAVEPSLFESFRRGQKPTSLKAAFDIKPSMAVDVMGSIYLEGAFIHSGAHFTARTYATNMQIVGNIEADLVKGKWFTSIDAPTEEKKIAGLTVIPSVFFKVVPSESAPKPLVEIMQVAVEDNGIIFPVNIELPIRKGCGFGIAATVRGELCRGGITEKGRTIFGKQKLIATIGPDENPAKKLEIAMQWISAADVTSRASSAAYTEEMGKWWRFIWGEDSAETSGSREERFELRSSDMSVAAVAEQTRAPLMQAGMKKVIALTIRGVGTEPPRAFWLQTITQKSLNDKLVTFNAKMTGTACGFKNQVFIALTTNFQRGGTKVGEIVTPQHQHMVREDLKLASMVEPLVGEVISIENREHIILWQRALTALTGTEIPASIREDIDMVPSNEPRLQPLQRIIERLIIKQERLARRIADPTLHRISPEDGDVIVSKLESIIEEAKEVQREAREAQEQIREQVMIAPAKKTIFYLCLKFHHAIKQHKILMEQVQALISGSALSGDIRARIQGRVSEIISSVIRIMEAHRQIMQEIRLPEEEMILPESGIESPEIPSLIQIKEMSNKQIEIVSEILKIKVAISKGANPEAIIPRTEQVLEHCKEIERTLRGIVEEVRTDEEIEKSVVEKPITILPHANIFKIILQQEQIHTHLKHICLAIKKEKTVEIESIIKVEKEVETQVITLYNIMAMEYDSLERMDYQATKKLATAANIPNLPVFMTSYFNVTYISEKYTPFTLSGKVIGSKSLEQLLFEMKQGDPKTRNPLVAKILENESRVTMAERERVETEINTLRKLKLEINFPPGYPLPVNCRKAIALYKIWVNYMTLGKMHLDSINVTTPAGQTRLDFQFSRNGEEVNGAIITPKHTIKFLGMKACPYLPAGISLLDTNTDVWEISRKSLRATCTCGLERVETFDGQLYEIPKILECEKVLAMDCSPAKSFAITLVPRERERVIKVVVNDHVVEIIPRRTIAESILKINGEVIALPEDGPLVIRGQGIYSSTPIELKIKRVEQEIILEAPQAGIIVRAHPNEIRIHASSFFRSKVCGICGNFDGQIVSELEDPERRVHASPDSLSVSYVIPSNKCDRESLIKTYPADIISQPAGECEPIRRNDVKERVTAGIKRVCISTSAIKRCPPGCQATETIETKIGYHCLRADDPSVLEIIEESKERALEYLVTREVDRSEEAIEPRRCIPL